MAPRTQFHDLDDPSELPPLCGEPEFSALLTELALAEAPRLFAVVQEYGERVDARIAGWGLAFEDRADVVGVEGGIRMSLSSPERALRGFRTSPHIHPRLVWLSPEA